MLLGTETNRSEPEASPQIGRAVVLVHGANHGGWCYSRVADILRSKGCKVYTPTLTGLGERSHLAYLNINCSTHIQDVLNVIKWEQLTDVILCGHSYGGMVIGGVADAIPERIASLVFLDAVVPEDNKSVFDLLPEIIPESIADAGSQSGQMISALPAAALNVNRTDQVMVDSLCTPQPFATFCERLKLTGAYLKVPRKKYVAATNWDHFEYTTKVRAALKENEGWDIVEIPCGHDVMLDAPDELAAILLDVH